LHCEKQEEEIFHLRNLSLRTVNRAFCQVFSNEGNNSFQNTGICQIICSHFPEETIILVIFWPTSSYHYASYCTQYCL